MQQSAAVPNWNSVPPAATRRADDAPLLAQLLAGGRHGVVIVDHSLPAPVPLGDSKHLGEAMAPIAHRHPLWIHTAVQLYGLTREAELEA